MPFVRFTRRRTRPVEASTTASYQAFGAASSVRCQARRTAVTSPKRTRRGGAAPAKGAGGAPSPAGEVRPARGAGGPGRPGGGGSRADVAREGGERVRGRQAG